MAKLLKKGPLGSVSGGIPRACNASIWVFGAGLTSTVKAVFGGPEL